MIGAQYDARFGFPSKIVLTRGRPKANVLWEAMNIAATVSEVKIEEGVEKRLSRVLQGTTSAKLAKVSKGQYCA
jgi:hypothetical protein